MCSSDLIAGLRDAVESFAPGRQIQVRARKADGKAVEFKALVRIDTPQEALYYKNGGILHYVLRQLLAGKSKPETVSAGIKTVADVASGSTLT